MCFVIDLIMNDSWVFSLISTWNTVSLPKGLMETSRTNDANAELSEMKFINTPFGVYYWTVPAFPFTRYKNNLSTLNQSWFSSFFFNISFSFNNSFFFLSLYAFCCLRRASILSSSVAYFIFRPLLHPFLISDDVCVVTSFLSLIYLGIKKRSCFRNWLSFDRWCLCQRLF